MDLFETINKEFKNRMLALIKPCFDFVEQLKKEQNRMLESGLLSMVTTSGKESDSARIAIQASKMKQNAESLINSSRHYIDDNRSLSRASVAYSFEDAHNDQFYSPVVILSGFSDKSEKEDTQIFLNPVISAGGKTDEMLRSWLVELKETNMSTGTMSRISEYFNQKLSDFDDGTPQTHRIAAQMRKLFEKSVMRTFA